MNREALRILFAPASGPAGSGEYYRCLALARALRERQPKIEIEFVLHRDARIERDGRFFYHAISATPARAGDEVIALIKERAPALVVFDSTGRVAQLRAARRRGARVAWISDRPGKRLKGFRLRQMRWTDVHIMVGWLPAGPRIRLYERALLAWFRHMAVEFAPAVVTAPDHDALTPWRSQLPGAGQPFAVFVAGGGGYRHRGQRVPDILLDAAVRFHDQCGMAAVVVMGPQYRGSNHSHPQVQVFDALPTAALGALLADANVVVAGAGSMLSAQVLAAAVPCVLVAAGGSDQPRRIRRFRRAGLALASPLEATAVADRALGLVHSAAEREGMVARQRALDIAGATDRAADRLLALAMDRP